MSSHDGEPLCAWIERDQFAYYLTLAYLTADPEDWPTFRRALHGALVATLYLDRHLDADTSSNGLFGFERGHGVTVASLAQSGLPA
jgi:hypothetical protein